MEASAPARSPAGRLALATAFVLFNLLLVECAARVLVVRNLPGDCEGLGGCVATALDPKPLDHFYRELRRARRYPPPPEALSVLMLGGSALHPKWGAVEVALREELALATPAEIHMRNLAEPAHTSRDSLLKYTALDVPPYDLVVVYHGINEARANNVPRAFYEADYGHYSWYREANAAARERSLPWTALPFAAGWLRDTLGLRAGRLVSLPTHRPRAEWLAEGGDLKTPASFRENLAALIARAEVRGEPLLLVTFATHWPDGYSLERFREHGAGYVLHHTETELWGLPEHVRAAVDAHNEVLRELAAASGVALVDLDRSLPRRRDLFNDVCHLTVSGSLAWAKAVAPAALALLEDPA